MTPKPIAQTAISSMTITLGGKSYECFSYPAGELQVRLNPHTVSALAAPYLLTVNVIARDLTMPRLIELALLLDAISAVNLRPAVNLILPYLPFSRADRRFVSGDCHGLKVMSELLNPMHWSSIRTLDVHNAEATKYWIPALNDIDPKPLVEQAMLRFSELHSSKTLHVLYPDEGSMARYSVKDLDELFSLTGPIRIRTHYCTKQRDPATGKLLGFEVPRECRQWNAPTLIIDDICDGGGTFLGIASTMRDAGYVQPFGLYVSHGIFSHGIPIMLEQFSHIYTTSSFTKNVADDDGLIKGLTVLNMWPLLLRS